MIVLLLLKIIVIIITRVILIKIRIIVTIEYFQLWCHEIVLFG